MAEKTLKQLIIEGRFTTVLTRVLTALVDRIKPYKVWTANVTVLYHNQTSGLLVVGQEYLIQFVEAGDDFANVGFEEINVPFIATGTTPTVWENNTEVIYYDKVIQVQQNELGEDVVLSIDADVATFTVTQGQFADDSKVWIKAPDNTQFSVVDENTLNIENFNITGVTNCIEFRIYN